VPAAALRQALGRRKKAKLVDVLVELAERDRGILRQLTARFDVATPLEELVAATHQANADATDFDERQIDRNFDYEYEAYGEVKRNLNRLIGSGQLRLAVPLALELMKQGRYQLEMGDEGLMAEDIEGCLNVVLEAVRKSDLPVSKGSPGARRCWRAIGWASSPVRRFSRCEVTARRGRHGSGAAGYRASASGLSQR
jgi:hypothetical protein